MPPHDDLGREIAEDHKIDEKVEPKPKEEWAPDTLEFKDVNDIHGDHPYRPAGVFSPKTRSDVVAVIQWIEKKKSRAKAVGSVWSLSRAPDSDGYVIRTDYLNKHLSQPFPTPKNGGLSPARGYSVLSDTSMFASSSHNKQWLGKIARPEFRQGTNSLVLVQAGIKIKHLYTDLATVGLALPTMGSAGGQSVVGAISTGTHGSDIHYPPLGDFVRAVHLIGPGGQEWWIEPNAGAGVQIDYAQLPDWDPDTRIVRDTDFLEAALVSVGRMGVIYSVILEVQPAYRLEEHRDGRSWVDVRKALVAGVKSDYSNVFKPSLADPSGKSEPLRYYSIVIDLANRAAPGTSLAQYCPEVALNIASLDYLVNNLHAPFSDDEKDRLDQLKDWYNKYCGAPGPGQLVWTDTDTYVYRRWATTNPEEIPQKPSTLLDWLCVRGEGEDFIEAMWWIATTFLIELESTVTFLLGMIPVAGPILASLELVHFEELREKLQGALDDYRDGGTLGALISTAMEALAQYDDSGPVTDLLHDLVRSIWSYVLKDQVADPPVVRGNSYEIMDSHDYNRDGCLSVHSSEFFFDAASAAYIGFLDALLHLAEVQGPIPGAVAVRYPRKSVAKIGMERFDRTVAVEVATSRPSTMGDQFMKDVRQLALDHGAIPHWGQEHQLTKAQVEARYDAKSLEDWRWAVSETEVKKQGTFSSLFTRNRGLEAIDIKKHRARRYVAAIVSSSLTP
jgi:hypothetical protein